MSFLQYSVVGARNRNPLGMDVAEVEHSHNLLVVARDDNQLQMDVVEVEEHIRNLPVVARNHNPLRMDVAEEEYSHNLQQEVVVKGCRNLGQVHTLRCRGRSDGRGLLGLVVVVRRRRKGGKAVAAVDSLRRRQGPGGDGGAGCRTGNPWGR
jgi:hypothetical protein